MTVDCHTHIWRREHWSEEIAAESLRARSRPSVLDNEDNTHWEAMKAVDRAIVFSTYALHSGFVVPNDFVARYVKQLPEKLIVNHFTGTSGLPRVPEDVIAKMLERDTLALLGLK
jgi:hypothetical protein